MGLRLAVCRLRLAGHAAREFYISPMCPISPIRCHASDRVTSPTPDPETANCQPQTHNRQPLTLS